MSLSGFISFAGNGNRSVRYIITNNFCMMEKFNITTYFFNERNMKHLQWVSELLRVSPPDVMGQVCRRGFL